MSESRAEGIEAPPADFLVGELVLVISRLLERSWSETTRTQAASEALSLVEVLARRGRIVADLPNDSHCDSASTREGNPTIGPPTSTKFGHV